MEIKIQLVPFLYLINDLSEYLNLPFEEVKLSVINCPRADRDKDDINWLYDLVQFNSYDYYKEERQSPLRGCHNLKILDYGCGIGTTSFWLANDNDVVGYDICEHALKFAEYRSQKHGFQRSKFVRQEPELSQFDLIIFIDILEHFKDLRPFIKHIGEGMMSGARIYHYDSFWQHIPGHYDHSKEIDSYIKESGLVKFDDYWAVKP